MGGFTSRRWLCSLWRIREPSCWESFVRRLFGSFSCCRWLSWECVFSWIPGSRRMHFVGLSVGGVSFAGFVGAFLPGVGFLGSVHFRGSEVLGSTMPSLPGGSSSWPEGFAVLSFGSCCLPFALLSHKDPDLVASRQSCLPSLAAKHPALTLARPRVYICSCD